MSESQRFTGRDNTSEAATFFAISSVVFEHLPLKARLKNGEPIRLNYSLSRNDRKQLSDVMHQ